MFEAPGLGFPTQNVAEAYGGEEAEEINARTGCVGCNLASKDKALMAVIKSPKWAYLAPLLELRPLYQEIKKPQYRLRKDGTERRKDGVLAANPMRMGPLTMDARRWGLEAVLDIQRRVNKAANSRTEISLIDEEERLRILELIAADTWPNGWEGTEMVGSVQVDQVIAENIIQPLLVR